MGNYSIHIEGIGAHNNTDLPEDADRLARLFVEDLRDKGHNVTAASFTCGSTEDLLIPEGANSNQVDLVMRDVEILMGAMYRIAQGLEDPKAAALQTLKEVRAPISGS
jgi:hypothetical protein